MLEKIEDLNTMVETLKLYHRINNEKLAIKGSKKKDMIEQIYIDPLPNNALLKKFLLKNTTFLVGKRGTGKSTIISRAQFEIRKNKDSISVYINAKTVFELSKGVISIDEKIDGMLNEKELRQLIILKGFLSEFSNSLKEELKEETNNIFTFVPAKKRRKQIDVVLNKIEEVFTNRSELGISKQISKSSEQVGGEKKAIGGKLSATNVSLDGQSQKNTEVSIKSEEIFIRFLNMNNLIKEMKNIIEICKRDGIYVFIDDYSELNEDDRKIFTEYIIEKFYHLAKDFVHLKIAAYPEKIEFGNLESKKYDLLSIDMYDIYGKKNNSDLEMKATTYTKNLIEKRIKTYTSYRKEEIFDFNSFKNEEECYKFLFYSSMCIPRELGIVIDNCLHSNVFHGSKINKTALIDASEKSYIEDTEPYYIRKLSSKDTSEKDIKDLMLEKELVAALIKKAETNRKALAGADNAYFRDLSDVPTSHFRVNKEYEYLLVPLEFNNFIYKIGELVGKGTSKDGTKNLEVLYSFNYGLCSSKKIIYGKPSNKDSKFFQQRAFNYSNLVGEILSKSKSICCENGHSFAIEDLEKLMLFKMNCPECLEKSIIVKCKEVSNVKVKRSSIIEEIGWTGAEIEILTAIHKYEKRKEKNISANLLEKEIDKTAQYIGNKCKHLASAGFVDRKKIKSKPFLYSLTEESKKILIQSNLVIY